MKTFILLILLSSTACFSQEVGAPTPPVDAGVNFIIEEIISTCMCSSGARFPGGNKELQKYIKSNFDWSLFDLEENKYKVYVIFVVNKSGNLSKIKVERGNNKDVNNALVNLFLNMPKWLPAETDGTLLRTWVRVPISVELL